MIDNKSIYIKKIYCVLGILQNILFLIYVIILYGCFFFYIIVQVRKFRFKQVINVGKVIFQRMVELGFEFRFVCEYFWNIYLYIV